MAQLRDTTISGSLRATDTIYTSTLQTQILHAPTASNGTTYGAGTNGQVLRTNGTSTYWGDAPATGVTSITIQTSSPLSGGSATATTGTGTYTIGFANQNKNLVLAGPSTGSAAAPSFRALVEADIPTISASKASLGNVSNNASLNGVTGAKGDIIYWSAANTPAHLTNTSSTTKHFLSITSQVPSWVTLSNSDVGLGNVENTKLSTWGGSTNIATVGTITSGTWKARITQTALSGSGTIGADQGASNTTTRYKPAVWTFNASITPTDGDEVTLKQPCAGHDHGTWLTLDNGSTYYPVVYGNGSRITTHFSNGVSLKLYFDASGTASVFAKDGGMSRVTATGVWRVLTMYDSNSNDTGYYHRRIYPNLKAGGAIHPYSIIMQLPNGKWSGITTTAPNNPVSGTISPVATGKAASTSEYMFGHVLVMYARATYADGNNIGTYNIWSAHTGLIDARYSFNLANSTGNGFVAYTPVYLVGTISNGLFKLDSTKWWTQTLPTSEDNKVYIYIGDAYDWYRMTFTEEHPAYWYKNGSIQLYTGYAPTAETANTANSVTWANVSNKPLTLTAAATGFTIAGGTTSKTLTVNETYTLGAACAKGVTDNTSNADVTSSDTKLITGRTLYYQLAKKGYTTNTGTVTSVQVQASAPLSSSTSTASSTTLSTTISFSNQNKNLVLAGPSSGSAAAPTFRALVADDIPTLSKSKVGLGNVDNTADANKSVNYATSSGSAINLLTSTTAITGGSTGTHAQALQTYFNNNSSTVPRDRLIAFKDTTGGNTSITFGCFISGTTKAYGGFFSAHYGTPYYIGIDNGTYTQYKIWKAGDSVTGAVWNDYAEYRKSKVTEPGRCVQENDNGILTLAQCRLIPGAAIISDTWGFSQGETEEAKTPIAVSGRVLAYPYRNRDKYHAGQAVCSGPNGTIDIMTRREIEQYPDAIVGIVSEIPDYEEWGGGNDRAPIKLDGRIWIKVR